MTSSVSTSALSVPLYVFSVLAFHCFESHLDLVSVISRIFAAFLHLASRCGSLSFGVCSPCTDGLFVCSPESHTSTGGCASPRCWYNRFWPKWGDLLWNLETSVAVFRMYASPSLLPFSPASRSSVFFENSCSFTPLRYWVRCGSRWLGHSDFSMPNVRLSNWCFKHSGLWTCVSKYLLSLPIAKKQGFESSFNQYQINDFSFETELSNLWL